MPEIIVPEMYARVLIAGTLGNAHLVYHDGTVLLVRRGSWLRYYQPRGALLIMTRDDLAQVDPDAFGYDPAFLAALLTRYARVFDPS